MPYTAPEPPRTLAWGNTNTASPDMVTPAYWNSGFPAPSGGASVKPPRGYINWLLNMLTASVRYYLQRGIPTWNGLEDGYPAGAVVRSPDNGILYQLVGTATTGTAPPADPTNWIPLLRRDAYGLPFGGYYEWLETWAGLASSAFTTSGGSAIAISIARWQMKASTTNTDVGFRSISYGASSAYNLGIDPGLPPNFAHQSGLLVDVGRAAGDYSRVSDSFPMAVLDDNIVLSIEMPMSVESNATTTTYFGFGCNQEINNLINGAFFWLRPGDTTWQARTVVNGTPTDMNTGVAFAAYVPHRFRIVCRGNAMGLGARAILFYIDDALVASSTSNLPFADTVTGGSNGVVQSIFGSVRNSTGSVLNPIWTGPLRYAQRFKAI